MTTKGRRHARVAVHPRHRASRQTPRGQFTSDRPIPPATSWWVGVPRAEWHTAVTAHARRWRRTEVSTPPRGE